jgi:colanic acid/amylovoran biosynthesis protein
MKSITVCLLWHGLDSGNLGVRALTESQLHLVKEVAKNMGREVTFEVVGWAATANPGKFRDLGVIRVLPVNSRSMIRPSGVWSAFRRADIVLDIGEGDSFSDIYGAKRLLYFCATKLLVLAAGRPLILSPQTLGPFSKWWSIWLSDWCLRKATHVFPRDELSRKYLEGRKLAVPFDEIVDVAFALPFDRPLPSNDGVTRIGINISGLLWSGGYTQNNQFGLTLDYQSLMRRTLRYFIGLEDVEIVLVPHVISDPSKVDGDTGAAAVLASEFPEVQLAPQFAGPSEAKSFISGLDFFVGARMHACIAAFSSGVPVVPLAYSRKFKGLFNTLGYSRVANCQQQTEQEVFDLVIDTFEKRQDTALLVNTGIDVAKGRLTLYRQRLVSILGKL